MKLAETSYDNRETGCCAPVDPAVWDGRTLTWEAHPFLKAHVRALFHVPLNFGSVVARAHAAVEGAEAYPDQPFWLSDEASPWGSDLYVALDRDLTGADVAHLSGTFETKVFEGPYRDAGKGVRAMEAHVRAQGKEPKRIYHFYATCPRCAKRFGKNQVVLFAQVA